MLEVSNKYKTAIKEPIRQFKRLVEINTGSTPFNNNTITSNDISEITNTSTLTPSNQYSKNRQPIIYNYASFEQDYTQLDGSFILPNKNFTNDFTGFIGSINSGSLTITPSGYFNYLLRNENNITIIFYDGYATDFEVSFECYMGGTTYTYTYTNNNNDKEIVIIEVPPYDTESTSELEIRSLTLTINQWSNSNNRFRIRKILGGKNILFEDSEILSIKLLEQTDFTNTMLPSNSLSIKVNNYDRKFNIIDLDNILNKLDKKSLIKVYNGLNIDGNYEYVCLGVYNYTDYKENEDKTLELNCNGILESFDELQQETTFGGQTGNVDIDMASSWILGGYDVSEVVYQGTIPANYTNFSSRKEQAQALSIYYSANIRELKPFSHNHNYTKNTLQMFNINNIIKKTISLAEQTKNPILTKFNKTKQITFSNLELKSLKSTATEIFNDSVLFEKYGGTSRAVIKMDNLSIPISVSTISVSVDGSSPYSFYTTGSNYFYLNVDVRHSSTSSQTRNVVITAKEYETKETKETIDNPNLEDGAVVEYNNIFVRSNYDRTRIANFIFEHEMDYRFETEILGDPSLEVGDTIILESPDGYHQATIDKIDTTDDGGYISRLEGVCSNVL